MGTQTNKSKKSKKQLIKQAVRAEFDRFFTHLEHHASDQLNGIFTAARGDLSAAAAALASECSAQMRESVEGLQWRSQQIVADLDSLAARVNAAADERIEEMRTRAERHSVMCDEASRDLLTFLESADRATRELQERSQQRIEGAAAAIDDRSLAVLSRLNALVEETVADADGINRRRIELDALAESLVVVQADARGCTAEAYEVLAQLREQAAEAALLAEQLPTHRDVDEPFAPLRDLEEPFDEKFFGNLAAEPGAHADGGDFPVGDHDSAPGLEQGTPRPLDAPSAPAHSVALLEPSADASGALAASRSSVVATDSVNVVAPVASLYPLVEELARNGNTAVRIEVSPDEATGVVLATRMRLVTYDTSGWWQCAQVRVAADSIAAVASAVVDVGELHEALAVIDRFDNAIEVRITFDLDRNLVVGNHLLLGHPHDVVPILVDERTPIERVDLRASKRVGLVLETQAGRLFVAPELLSLLRQRRISIAELVSVGGFPHLSATVPTAVGDDALTVVGRLLSLGDHDEPGVCERRDTRGDEVTQLVNALSADTTPAELERILKVGTGYTRRRAAAHPALPPEVIDGLLRDGTEAIRAAAAANTSISSGAVGHAVVDDSPVVRAAAGSNPALSPDQLEQLAGDAVPHVRAHVAANVAAPRTLIELLAADEDSSVRAAVAARHSLAIDTMLVLARDPDSSVCRAIAGNPECPAEILSELVGIVPDSVLANPKAPASLLVAGSEVGSSRLREAVARNPSTPPKGLRKLARDSDLEVLRAVAEHPETPPAVRRRLHRELDGT